MTVAAVKVDEDKIEVGCDSIMLSGNSIHHHTNKMRTVSGLLFIGAGCYQEVVMLDLFINEHGTPENATEADFLNFIFAYNEWKKDKGFIDNDKDPSVAEWIFVYQGKAFSCYYYTVYEIKKGFHTIGAGREIATGALAAGAHVNDAIQIACDYCADCALPVQFLSIPKKGVFNENN